jgi:hypothetical protein
MGRKRAGVHKIWGMGPREGKPGRHPAIPLNFDGEPHPESLPFFGHRGDFPKLLHAPGLGILALRLIRVHPPPQFKTFLRFRLLSAGRMDRG